MKGRYSSSVPCGHKMSYLGGSKIRQRLNVLDDDEAFFKRKMFHKNN